jgi:transcriptional regulator with XRE-family HTH domain
MRNPHMEARMAKTKKKAPETVSSVVGRQVQDARKRLRLKQADLAKRLDDLGVPTHQATIHRLETGGRRVSVDDVLAIAAALGVSPLFLLTGDYTNEAVPIAPKLEPATPPQMRRWFSGQVQLPELDADSFVEVIPDTERIARQRRGFQHLRQAYLDWHEAVLVKDFGAMRDALKDIERELARQEADLDREERRAKEGDENG